MLILYDRRKRNAIIKLMQEVVNVSPDQASATQCKATMTYCQHAAKKHLSAALAKEVCSDDALSTSNTCQRRLSLLGQLRMKCHSKSPFSSQASKCDGSGVYSRETYLFEHRPKYPFSSPWTDGV